MNKKKSSKNKNIVVFDANLKMVAMFSSCYAAEKTTGISHQMITKACNGTIIAAMGMYWREVDIDQYVLDCDDLGVLTLIEFDREHGVDRLIYATRNMKKNEIILESKYKRQ